MENSARRFSMKTVFTYAHVKWFYGQSERAYYLNYFIKQNDHCGPVIQSAVTEPREKFQWKYEFNSLASPNLLRLSLHDNFVNFICLRDFNEVQHFAINDGFSVQFDNVIHFVDLNSRASGYAQHAMCHITILQLLRGWKRSIKADLRKTWSCNFSL